MKPLLYYVILDNGCQWQNYVISYSPDKDRVVEYYNINDLNCEFLGNIWRREMMFGNRRFNILSDTNEHFGGWSISRAEFDRIKKLVELLPSVIQFNKLSQYE